MKVLRQEICSYNETETAEISGAEWEEKSPKNLTVAGHTEGKRNEIGRE